MIDWSLIGILDSPVTHGNSHELVTLMVLALDNFWELDFGLQEIVDVILSHSGHDIVGTDLLLHLTVVDVLVHGVLGDWDNGFNHVPKDTLHKGSGGQGALVGESAVVLAELNELAQVEGAQTQVLYLRTPILTTVWFPLVFHIHLSKEKLLVMLLINQFHKEIIVEKDIWILGPSLFKVTIWHDLEKESKNTCKELRGIFVLRSKLGWADFVINEMDDVHLKVHQFSIDGVF